MQGSAIDATRADCFYEDMDDLTVGCPQCLALCQPRRSVSGANNYAGLPHSVSSNNLSVR
jgi:hypothetical protein